ncbi:MAG: discoidin domain-containing protein [Verrucomicrobia bacterium]|jgi:hypothetical protein|nr:discoidin domain-containing protein [Verrucomicrobiota bacterium]
MTRLYPVCFHRNLLHLLWFGGCLGFLAGAPAADLEPLILELPAPAFKGTPKDMAVDPEVEPLSDTPRPPMMVPKGLLNLAKGKAVTSSTGATGATTAQVVDGDKEGYDTSAFLMKKGTQWVQIDLGATSEIFAIVVWHAHDVVKIYRDVIVQVSDDPGFKQGVQTLYNNDRDNSSGLGAGQDREYFETAEGRLIDAQGVKGRYVRSYTRGSTDSALNECVEIEVYGRPAP